MAEPLHLSNHHRDTVEQIQGHPTSRNVDWRAATALLEHIADIEETNGNKVAYTVGGSTLVLNRPADGKTLDVQQVVDVRAFLTRAGYS